jgi:hypothetical protein
MSGAAAPAPAVIWPIERARRPSKLAAGATLAMVGDVHVQSLARHLGPLCKSAKVTLYLGRQSQSDEQLVADVRAAVEGSQVTLVSWPSLPRNLVELGVFARARGRSLALVGYPGRPRAINVPTLPVERFDIHLGPDGRTPTAAGYSAWAGALWHWIR